MSQNDGYITINGTKYSLINNRGASSLTRYNEKHKIWVRLRFSDVSQPNSVIDVLSRQYVHSVIQMR